MALRSLYSATISASVSASRESNVSVFLAGGLPGLGALERTNLVCATQILKTTPNEGAFKSEN